MLEASKHITSTITTSPTIIAALSGGFYWELGAEDVKTPFATYTVVETPGRTKDSAGTYRVSIFVWAENLTTGAGIADTIKKEVPADWKFEMAQNGYTDTDAKEAYIEVVFNFKL